MIESYEERIQRLENSMWWARALFIGALSIVAALVVLEVLVQLFLSGTR